MTAFMLNIQNMLKVINMIEYLGTPNEVPNEMVLPDPFTDVFWIHLCGEKLAL